MQEIVPGVYIETGYIGVTVGVVTMEYGTVYIDSPPCPEQARVWRNTLRALGKGIERALVYLDHHPDRTLGGRVLDCPIVVQEKTAQIFRSRPAIFRAKPAQRGEAWEICPNISNMRWAQPQMAFGQRLAFHWDKEITLVLEHHPGPAPGAVWAVLPSSRVVFVGDTVTLREPPFLARADLDAWIEALDLLLSKQYRDFLIVAGRGGLVPDGALRHMRRFLAETRKQLNALAARQAPPEATEDLVPKLLAWWEFDPTYDTLYADRLRHGLQAYYRTKYHIPDPAEKPPKGESSA